MFQRKHNFDYSKSLYIFALFYITLTIPTFAQHHYNNWIHRNATDTTIARCWDDSLTFAMFPPGSMMGMMFPDSIYCRIDRMHLDSLDHPHDSTFMGWHRIEIGRDSTRFDMMDDSMMSVNHMMQFMTGLQCQLRWDSLYTDSLHRRWKPTGVRGWNGTQWVNLSDVSFIGTTATVKTSQVYAAIAFVGTPSEVTGISPTVTTPSQYKLEQNYPNPFNPSTEILFNIPLTENVTLEVYNVLGKVVATLFDNQPLSAGEHSVLFDANNLASGIYFYSMRAGQYKSTQKMILLR
ncbi:MAG: T9SS type A sorting domain-containing protein [Ignavibacteriales bacterium]|nr:T9SS type A sorting domain-containing protein [Ignavibacteriales bacterium]